MKNKIERKRKYARAEEVSACRCQDHAILYNPDTNREKIINPSALLVWEKLDGRHTVEEISDALLEEYEADSRMQVQRDTCQFIGELLADRFIKIGQGSPRPLPVAEYADIADRPGDCDVSLTGKCNLHCDYCFYAHEMHDRPDLSTREWMTFFDELGRLGVRTLTLSGGEVFVRNEWFDLLDHIAEQRMRYSILSNGTLIDERTVSRLEEKRRRLRLNSIQVSIDGSCAEIHDKSRGEGSFKRAIRGLRLLKEAGFPVTSRVTVNRHNVDDLDDIAALLLEDIGLNSFGTNDAMPMGAGCDNQAGVTLLPRQQVQAMETLIRLEKKYGGRINATAGPLAKWSAYGEMERARATGELTGTWQMGFLTACGCVFNKLAVHHDGVIAPCNMLPTLELGRINRDRISDIWKNHPILKALKGRRRIPMTDVPGCEDCEWARFCNGSCPGLALSMTGDFNRANPHDCYRNFLHAAGLATQTVPWAKRTPKSE
jgi:SynChlorMet cassette radical SAM/SPASM protein ScmE